jgi:hypothetical protein
MELEMDNYALINIQTNLVENVIVWDPQNVWTSPEGFICIKVDGDAAEIGSTYDPVSQTFTPPPREIDSTPGAQPNVID